MKLMLTTSARNALKEIKEKMLNQYENKDINRFKIKFTKKKEFLAVPFPFDFPAFQLYLNGKFQNTYFLKNNKWKIF